MNDLATFRASFPVLERCVYLNAGTDGPLPRAAAKAMSAHITLEEREGRSGFMHFLGVGMLWEELRQRLASLLGATAEEVALTASTTDGMNSVIWGLGLSSGDEVITSDEEHPGLLAPLAVARKRLGIELKVVPLADVASEVTSRTRLVCCSHVSWITGARAPVDSLASLDVPVLLDGAQSLGAIPVDVSKLGCDYYAVPGQKWLCGPDGTGALFVRAEAFDTLSLPWPNYLSLSDTERPLELVPNTGARRFDTGFMPGCTAAGLVASLDVLEEAGWEWVLSRGPEQASRARELLSEQLDVVPADGTTLVSWHISEAMEEVARLADAGIMVRDIPGWGLVRASVGAWTDDEDIERLVAATAENVGGSGRR